MNYLLDRQDLYNLDKNEIIELLQLQGDDLIKLIKKANEIRLKYRGDKVYFRGLIENSNICRKLLILWH